MSEEKATLLIVEDDIDVADMLNAYFRTIGYEVMTVNWGEDGVRAALTDRPDLVILDIRLPDIDGFEVASRLRQNRRTRDLPIIFLTEKRERADRLRGLQLSPDDYITKPFDIQELRLRIRNALERARRNSLTHPVTGAPEGPLVEEYLQKFLAGQDWGLVVLSLKRFKKFSEAYGFVAADDLLRAVAIMIQDVIKENVPEEDIFLGHLSTTDFVIMTKVEFCGTLRDQLSRRLDQSFDYFYRDQDRISDTFGARRLLAQVEVIFPDSSRGVSLSQLKSRLERILRQDVT